MSPVATLTLALVGAVASAPLQAQQTVTLVRNGQPQAALVLPAEAHDDEQLAARELQTHLEKMSGAQLPIVQAPPAADTLAVRVGLSLTPAAEARIREVSDDQAAFLLEVTPRGVTLAGLSPEGTLFSAYELLESLGCRWYLPGDLGTVVPHRSTVTLPIVQTVKAPSFPHRHLQTVSKSLPWYRRQRLGGLYFPGAHGIRLSPPANFDTEPELFGLLNGERSKRQLCVSNPEVVARAARAAIEYFDKNPEAPWIGMGPNDGRGFCECENCRALDAGQWDPYAAAESMTDRYVWFFNQVLAEVHKKHPGKKICFYAYSAYNLPPRKVKPDQHIVPAFAPITLCRIHGMSNPICPDRSFYKTLMVEWGQLVPEIFERGYYFNLACPGLPFSKIHAVRDETVVAYKAGVKGWRVECMPAWASCGPTLYVASRLMWDVHTDVDALLEEFCDKFFGPAALPLSDYLELVDTAFRDTDCHTGASYCMPRVFTPERMARGEELLTRAEALARGDEVFAKRVQIFRLNFNQLRAFLDMLEARNRFDFVAAKQALDRMSAVTDTMLAFRLYPNEPETEPGKKKSVRQLDGEARLQWSRTAHSYVKRFWAPCTESGYERLQRGELVAGVPDEWDFLLDTTNVGESVGWFRSGPLGGNWWKLRTKTASWSDQGLHYYKGLAWYRTQVDIPARFGGRRVYLWFGGVDETAKVWLNGKLLGTSQEPGEGLPGVNGAFKPFEFDATRAVRFGEPNWIAVKITNEKLNEVGTGGITAPVMFWSPNES